MPPQDYSQFKAVVPDSGIATASAVTPQPFLTDANGVQYDAAGNVIPPAEDPVLSDPTIRQYIADQNAAREPWTDYFTAVGKNLYNTGKAFLPTALGGEGAVGVSDMAKGALESAVSAATLPGDAVTGKIELFDPVTGRPTDEAMARMSDLTGMLTLGAGAIPAEANTLRMGAKALAAKEDRVLVVHGGSDFDKIDKDKLGSGEPGGIRPLGNGLYGYVVPLDNPEMAKEAIDGAKTFAKKYGKGDKTVHVFSVPKSALLTSNGPIPLEGFPERQLGKPGQRPTPEEVAAFKAESQLYAEKLPGGLVEMSILDPSVAKRVDKFSVNDSTSNILESLTGGKRRSEKRPDGFYSRAEEVLLNQPTKSGTAEQFYAMLKNAGREKEAKALGLDKLTGPTDVYKLRKQIEASEPRLKDVNTSYFEGDTMPGGTNYRMMNVTWDNPDATYGMHPFTYTPHYLPNNTLFHARLKDDVYTGADGVAKKVLRVEELQSDWAQSTKGQWSFPVSPDRIQIEKVPLDKLGDELVKRNKNRIEVAELRGETDVAQKYRNLANSISEQARKRGDQTATLYRVQGVQSDDWQILGTGDTFNPEELIKETQDTFGQDLAKEGRAAFAADGLEEMLYNEQFGYAPAPYVSQGSSGWLPLAAKKLLLEAAKTGADEIVIAPGKVHANRWASQDPVKARGLTSFYDNITPKEFSGVLKDVEKETGIKGLKMEVEERPFVDHGGRKQSAQQQDPSLWYTYVDPSVFDVHSQEDVAALGHAYHRAVNSIEQNLGTPDEVFTELGNSFKRDLEMYQALDKSNEEVISSLESQPPPTNSDEMNRFLANYDAAIQRRDHWSERMANAMRNMNMLPKAREMYMHWLNYVKATPDPTDKKAWVIKLTPDLREYILKNGLPRMAKGGIVDLAEMSAFA